MYFRYAYRVGRNNDKILWLRYRSKLKGNIREMRWKPKGIKRYFIEKREKCITETQSDHILFFFILSNTSTSTNYYLIMIIIGIQFIWLVYND